MKQKILIRVTMTDDKTRAKAMKNAVQFSGVTAVELKGDHRNQIEVTGDEVDMIGLTNRIRKKVAFAELVSVSKVEPPKGPDGPKPNQMGGGDNKGGDQKPSGDQKPDNKKPDDKKPENKKPDDKKPEENKPAPCIPPWPYGYGVPSSYPYPCNPHPCNPYPPSDPHHYIGEPAYNHEPNCRIM